MFRQRTIAGTFLLFAPLAAAFVAVVTCGLWENRGVAYLCGGAVGGAGLAVGLLGRRFFFFMKDIQDAPVLLARQADAAAVCMAVALLVVYMVPVLEFIDWTVALAAMLGVEFLALIYAGVCLGVAVEYAPGRLLAVAGAFLAGIAVGIAAGYAAGTANLPSVLLACAVCGASASLVFGAGYRRVSMQKGGWKRSVITAVAVLVLCVAGIAVLVMAEPVVSRMGREGKGMVDMSTPEGRQLVNYIKNLYTHVIRPVRMLFLAVVAATFLYAIVVAFLKDSKKIILWHSGARHMIVSVFVLAVICAVLYICIAKPDFAAQYEMLRGYTQTTILSGGGG